MTSKRKREDTTDSSSPLPTPRLQSFRPAPRSEPQDPTKIIISKNFARVAATILQDVTAHKVAGIFSKPLSKRDAPDYDELIYRPADLSSIRKAVNKGSRAANAIIDGMSEDEQESAKGATASTWVVQKSDELIPPEGIVNSSQLEMELVRMFANAIMFNPLPASERGFGPAIGLTSDGVETEEDDDDELADDEDVKKSYGYADSEEGGIIHDARDMFESVVKAVESWRSVEQDKEDDVPRSGPGLRGGSMEVSSAMGENHESTQEPEDDTSTVGTGRKRRRIGAE